MKLWKIVFITSKKIMTEDEERLVVVHLGFSKTDKVAKNSLQSLKNSVLTCITHFIAPVINKSTRGNRLKNVTLCS